MNSPLLKDTPCSSFAVFGTGAVGFAALMASKVAGASIRIAVDVIDSRLALAKELGATHTINSKTHDPVKEIKAITGLGVTFAVEATGRPQVLRQAINALGMAGCVGVVGAPKAGTEASFNVLDILLSGKSIRGIIEGDSVPRLFIPKLVDLYLTGRFPIDKISKIYKFHDIEQARKDSESGVTVKPILTMR